MCWLKWKEGDDRDGCRRTVVRRSCISHNAGFFFAVFMTDELSWGLAMREGISLCERGPAGCLLEGIRNGRGKLKRGSHSPHIQPDGNSCSASVWLAMDIALRVVQPRDHQDLFARQYCVLGLMMGFSIRRRRNRESLRVLDYSEVLCVQEPGICTVGGRRRRAACQTGSRQPWCAPAH